MRALILAPTAALALALSGCGQQPTEQVAPQQTTAAALTIENLSCTVDGKSFSLSRSAMQGDMVLFRDSNIVAVNASGAVIRNIGPDAEFKKTIDSLGKNPDKANFAKIFDFFKKACKGNVNGDGTAFLGQFTGAPAAPRI